MRIKLISAALCDKNGNPIRQKKASAPSLTIYYLASMVPKRHIVSVLDENIEDINFDEPLDLVGITVLTQTAKRAYEIADGFRKRGVTTVMGGIHASFLPYEVSKHADAVVIGEAEDSWPKLINDFENKKLDKIYQNPRSECLDDLPHPRYDLIDYSKYIRMPFRRSPFIPLQTQRGCPHDCDFCAVTKFWGNKLRYRPITNIMDEIKLSDADTFFFTDDNFIGNYKRTEELCQALIPLKIKYVCFLDTTCFRKPDLIKLLARSGCTACFIGFETLSKDNLKEAKKSFCKPEEYESLFRLLHKNGISIYASMIFGFDNDNPVLVRDTVKFLIKQKATLCAFYALTPLPGSVLYERLKQDRRLLDNEWWLAPAVGWGNKIKYKDGQFNGYELCQMAARQFFSWPSIVKRCCFYGRNRLLSLYMNIKMKISFEKEGMAVN